MLQRHTVCYIYQMQGVQGFIFRKLIICWWQWPSTAVSAGLGRVAKYMQKMLNRKDPRFAIFLKSWGFKDVKYDISIFHSHSTRPQLIQLGPTTQKSSLRHHFRRHSWKFNLIGWQKLLQQATSSFPSVNKYRRHIWDKKAHCSVPLWPKNGR